MSRYKKLLIVVAVLTVSAVLLSSLPVLAKAKPIIWSVDRIIETLEQGESCVLNVSFHSDVELHDVELFASDEIWPFVMSIPGVLPLVEQGSDTTIRIRAFAPTTTEPGTYEGTLHVKQSHRTFPQLLKIRLTITEAIPGTEVIECAPSGNVEISENPDTGAKAASNQVLVIFDAGMTADDINTLLDDYRMRVIGQITVLDVYQIEIPTGADPWTFADLLNADPRVALAGVNDVGEPDTVPSDPAWQDTFDERRWGFERIRAPEAWSITTGSSDVTLAIIDSGVDLNHSEFAGRLILGSDLVWGVLPWDLNGHGTNVAGVMAALGNGGNDGGEGMAGMCWNSKLYVIKDGHIVYFPFALDTINGIIEASNAGAKVINVSSGWSDPNPLTKWLFENAVSYAGEALVVASAGNEGVDEDTSQHYPSIIPQVLSVGATNMCDGRPTWSNSGPTVDIGAPGTNIYTTAINGYTPYTPFVGYVSGTSYAAPFASGLAGLIWSVDYDGDEDFDFSPADVKRIITSTADPADLGFGGGRMNAYNALRQAIGELDDFADLGSGVSKVVSPGVPGPVQAESPYWLPIVAGDENAACGGDTSGPTTFVMARPYEAGRVAIMGHDGLIGSTDLLDNERLMLNIISWLDTSDGKNVILSSGHSEWVTASKIGPLITELESQGYSFEVAPAPISSSSLAGRDVLIFGNAWDTVSASEIDAVETFVANGGGLLLIGLGWSWGHYHPGSPIEEYPMMKLAAPYGVRWLECYLWDVYYDQTPVFDVFYPNMPEYGVNLVLNPGFENELECWSSTGGTATYESDIPTCHTGWYSAKGTETSEGNLGRLYQDVTGIVSPGARYKIGGWIRTQGVDGHVVIALDYVTSGGWSPAEGYVKEIGYVSGTQDWTYYESDEFVLPPMPASCVAAWFLFDFNAGKGSAWWDDVFLVRTG